MLQEMVLMTQLYQMNQHITAHKKEDQAFLSTATETCSPRAANTGQQLNATSNTGTY